MTVLSHPYDWRKSLCYSAHSQQRLQSCNLDNQAVFHQSRSHSPPLQLLLSQSTRSFTILAILEVRFVELLFHSFCLFSASDADQLHSRLSKLQLLVDLQLKGNNQLLSNELTFVVTVILKLVYHVLVKAIEAEEFVKLAI